MAGHSHWKNTKRTREADAKKRASIFTKMGKVISLAVKDGGPNIDSNPSLRLAVEKARKSNMPKDNIERAIRKVSGETKGGTLESFIFEAYGPGGVAVIVEGITDNKNRSLSDFKTTINKYNGKFAESRSVKWMFEKRGLITIPLIGNIDDLEVELIELGADNYEIQDKEINIYTKPEELEKIKSQLKAPIESASLIWIPLNSIEISEKEMATCDKMFEELDDNDDIQEIYSNIK